MSFTYIAFRGTIVVLMKHDHEPWNSTFKDLRFRKGGFCPKSANPPQRIRNGVFLGFGRGVFLVNALEEKLPERHQKRRRGGGRRDVIR